MPNALQRAGGYYSVQEDAMVCIEDIMRLTWSGGLCAAGKKKLIFQPT